MNRAERAALADVHRTWKQGITREVRQASVRLHCADCGEFKPHCGKGLCATCYYLRHRKEAQP